MYTWDQMLTRPLFIALLLLVLLLVYRSITQKNKGIDYA